MLKYEISYNYYRKLLLDRKEKKFSIGDKRFKGIHYCEACGIPLTERVGDHYEVIHPFYICKLLDKEVKICQSGKLCHNYRMKMHGNRPITLYSNRIINWRLKERK